MTFNHQSFCSDLSTYFPEHKAAAIAALGSNPQCLSTLTEPDPEKGGYQITTTWAAEPKPEQP